MDNQYTYEKASRAAQYIVDLLRPYSDRIHIAGSIRRMRPMVKDIEIVCIPKKEEKKSGLFSDVTETIVDRNFTEALATITDIVVLGSVEGRMMKIRTNSKSCPGIHLDLFMPIPNDYFRIYAIRTGSAEYAAGVLARAWKRKGWCGAGDHGLRLISECDFRSGKYYPKKTITEFTLPPVWQNEAEFFKWLKLDYIDPMLREHSETANISL